MTRVQVAVCSVCGDSDRWETTSKGEIYCECQVCECGWYEQHETGCHWANTAAPATEGEVTT